MKHGLTLTLMIAAALAAAPAMAQRSVSGTIGAAHGAATIAPAAASAATPAPTSAATPAAAPAAQLPAAAGETAPADAAAVPAKVPAPSAPLSAAATPPGALAMTIPTPTPSASSGSLLSTIFALMFVLALLIGLAWLMKRYGPKNFGGGNSNVKLVGALSVGARERILVVEVGEQWIVVGASPGRMNALATMARQDGGALPVSAPLPTANFAEWFKQTIEKRNGK